VRRIGGVFRELERLERVPRTALRVRAIAPEDGAVRVTLRDGGVRSIPTSVSGIDVARLFGYATEPQTPDRVDTTPEPDLQWPQLHYWLGLLEDRLTESGLEYERIERVDDAAHIVVTDGSRRARWIVDLAKEVPPDIADDIVTSWHGDHPSPAFTFLD